MQISISSQINMESAVAVLSVTDFRIEWGANEHAFLFLNGYLDTNASNDMSRFYESKIRLWMPEDDTTLFYGFFVKGKITHEGKTCKIALVAASGSYWLDQTTVTRSFQNVKETYADVVKKVTNAAGGNVICTKGTQEAINKPLIQYQETAWKYGMRLASHLGTCVVPDIAAGGKNFWFGMRKGRSGLHFDESEYQLVLYRDKNSGNMKSNYEIKSRDYHMLGDKAVIHGQEVVIFGMTAVFENGALVFHYRMTEGKDVPTMYQNEFIGLGLKGTVVETQKEQIKIALDVDGGKSTGDYFYEWYPETGNGLYAVPEIGSRAVLYFPKADEREGFVIHCIPNAMEYDRYPANKDFRTKEGNTMHLYEEDVSFIHKGNHSVSLGNGNIYAGSSKKLRIYAEDNVNLSANRILIRTQDELNICQG